MDERLRQLERDGEQEKLEIEYLRLGRGWKGEYLPDNVKTMRASRGRYLLSNRYDQEIELVYVPAGKTACTMCDGKGNFGTIPDDPRLVFGGLTPLCAGCRGTGEVDVAPFYVGRCPVLRQEYEQFLMTAMPSRENDRRQAELGRREPLKVNHPAADVSFEAADFFCTWSGGRLPTSTEWWRMSLGPGRIPCPHHAHVQGKKGCTSCEDGIIHPRFPWGFNAWGVSQPADDLCVWGEHTFYDGTAPVLVREYRHARACPDFNVVPSPWLDETCACFGHRWPEGQMVPARPFGASWCGALDTFGNVSEWCSDKIARGGSFRTTYEHYMRDARSRPEGRIGGVWGTDEVGLRVAVCGL